MACDSNSFFLLEGKFKNCEAFFKCAEKFLRSLNFLEIDLIFLRSLKILVDFLFYFFKKYSGRNCVSFFFHAHRAGASGGRFLNDMLHSVRKECVIKTKTFLFDKEKQKGYIINH